MIHAAAIRYKGTIYTLPRPARHVDVFMVVANDHSDATLRSGERGFIIDTGEFLSREAAARHAMTCGQVSSVPGGELYSEMVW